MRFLNSQSRNYNMRGLNILFAATLFYLGDAAYATSFVVTTDAFVSGVAGTTHATSDVTSSFKDDKIVLAARDDAAAYAGSDGEIRGVQLESAFAHIRAVFPNLNASDSDLASAILAI